MARRRSPDEAEIRVSRTAGEAGTFSVEEMCWRRARVDVGSSGLKRNLEQRDARGSMILHTGSIWSTRQPCKDPAYRVT